VVARNCKYKTEKKGVSGLPHHGVAHVCLDAIAVAENQIVRYLIVEVQEVSVVTRRQNAADSRKGHKKHRCVYQQSNRKSGNDEAMCRVPGESDLVVPVHHGNIIVSEFIRPSEPDAQLKGSTPRPPSFFAPGIDSRQRVVPNRSHRDTCQGG
jgi:hypothetical protein